MAANPLFAQLLLVALVLLCLLIQVGLPAAPCTHNAPRTQSVPTPMLQSTATLHRIPPQTAV